MKSSMYTICARWILFSRMYVHPNSRRFCIYNERAEFIHLFVFPYVQIVIATSSRKCFELIARGCVYAVRWEKELVDGMLFRERHIPMTNPFYNLQAVFLATRAGSFVISVSFFDHSVLKSSLPPFFFFRDSFFFLPSSTPSSEG